MNLTGKQWIAISIGVLGVLMISQAQLTDLFGASTAKYIQSASGLINMILGSVLAALTGNVAPGVQLQQLQQAPGGQEAIVRNVMNMPGVESLEVNKKATPELAQLAVNPELLKISPKPSDAAAVTNIAAANP